MPAYTWVNRVLYKVTVQITEQISRRIQNTVKHLKWSILKKKSCLSAATQPEIFLGRGGFVELGHFYKNW